MLVKQEKWVEFSRSTAFPGKLGVTLFYCFLESKGQGFLNTWKPVPHMGKEGVKGIRHCTDISNTMRKFLFF